MPNKSEFKKPKLKSILYVLIIILIGMIAFRYGVPKIKTLIKGPEKKKLEVPEIEEEAVRVRIYEIRRGMFEDVLPLMGTVEGIKKIELSFQTSGLLNNLYIKEGDVVRKGEIIARQDPRDAQLKLEYNESKIKSAEIEMKSAAKKVEIYQNLYDIGTIIKPKLEEVILDYENAKSKVESANKEVEFAKAELEKTVLTAPMDGVIGTKDVEEGEYLTQDKRVTTLYDVTEVYVSIGVIEKDIDNIQKAFLNREKASVNVDTYPGVEFEGKLDNLTPVISGKSRMMTAKVRVKNDNPSGTLLPGMFSRVGVRIFSAEDVLVVPASALHDVDNDGKFDTVFISGVDNKAHMRQIKLGHVASDYTVVSGGIEEGESVIIEAFTPITDGIPIEVLEVQKPAF